mgnify:CR=1 FL=1
MARRAEALTAGEAGGATQERVRQVLNDLQMVARLEELRLRLCFQEEQAAMLRDLPLRDVEPALPPSPRSFSPAGSLTRRATTSPATSGPGSGCSVSVP